jgi:hypothetical protein
MEVWNKEKYFYFYFFVKCFIIPNRIMNMLRLSGKLMPLWAVFIIIFFAPSCKKQSWLKSGGKVLFSVDTLMFDTVFTAQGSATRSIRIFNPQKENIQISSIRMGLGSASPYRLNVNGYSGTEIRDIDIAGKDSVWIFAAVTIDPDNEDNPFVVSDQLIVTLNDQEFSIPVIAFGQNAYYIVDSVLETQTWLTDNPYVNIRNALVNANATLTIPAGTRVYMHQDSRLFVQGTLNIAGTKQDSVIFQGDRLDRDIYVGDYSDVPGEWGGLYFFPESHGNIINYAIFKNGGAATDFFGSTVLGATIQLNKDSFQSGQPVLKITNSVIHHSQGYGIVSFNSNLYAENCLIAECGAENLMIFEGGTYRIYDCTIATYGGDYLSHDQNVSMGILNYYPISQNEFTGADLNVDLRNTIVYGSLENEMVVDKKDNFAATINIRNCLLRSEDPVPAFVQQSGIKLNEDPEFKDRVQMDYHPDTGSPAIGAGISAGELNTDLDGVIRANPPSIGCYE